MAGNRGEMPATHPQGPPASGALLSAAPAGPSCGWLRRNDGACVWNLALTHYKNEGRVSFYDPDWLDGRNY